MSEKDEKRFWQTKKEPSLLIAKALKKGETIL